MDELQKYLGDSKPTLLEMYATWCPHCQKMAPVVEELRVRMGDKAHIVQLDGEKNEDVMRQYSVASYPCWILFKDGQTVWRDYGEKPLSELEDMIRRFI